MAAAASLALVATAAMLIPSGAAASTSYGATGTFTGRTGLISKYMPAGSRLSMTLVGSMETGNEPMYAGWSCYPWQPSGWIDVINSRGFVISPATSAYAAIGPYDWDNSCTYVVYRGGGQHYTIDLAEVTYTPPDPGYVQPPYPTAQPSFPPAPTFAYPTPSLVPTPNATLCLQSLAPDEYGPPAPGPCPTATPAPTIDPSSDLAYCQGHWYCWYGTVAGGPNSLGLAFDSVAKAAPLVNSGQYRVGWQVTFDSIGNMGMWLCRDSPPDPPGQSCATRMGTPGTPWDQWPYSTSFTVSNVAWTAPSVNVTGASWYPVLHLDRYHAVIHVRLYIDPAAPGFTPAPSGGGWLPTPAPTAYEPGPTCAPGQLCGPDGGPGASGPPGGGGSGTGTGGLGNGNGLGPNTAWCASTGHPVGPISGECKPFMLDYWTVGDCEPITDPLKAIGWVGCVATQIVAIAPNVMLYGLNGIIDLAEPGQGLAAAYATFSADAQTRVPFVWIASAITAVYDAITSDAGAPVTLDGYSIGGQSLGLGTLLTGVLAEVNPYRGVIFGIVALTLGMKFYKLLGSALGIVDSQGGA